MTRMFDNYDNQDQYYIPNNRHRFNYVDETDEIVVGGTATHVFKLDLLYSRYCEKLEVFYNQSITRVLKKSSFSKGIAIDEREELNTTFITVTLTPEETKLFTPTRETYAQLKLYLTDGQVIYLEKGNITVKDTLDNTVLENNEKLPFTRFKPAVFETIDEEGNIIQTPADFLFEVWYDELDHAFVDEFLKTIAPQKIIPDCTSLRVGNFYGRNYDWNYCNDAVFVTHVSHKEGRFAFDGVAAAIPGLTKEFVESGAYSDNYKLIPFYLLDGKNEEGVVCSINVVPADSRNDKFGTKPDIEEKEKVCAHLFPEYILEHFATARQAAEYIRDYASVYNINSLLEMGYDIHLMIADKYNGYIIEFVDNKNVIVKEYKPEELMAMTNFHINGVKFNEDEEFALYSPETQDEEHDAIKTNNIDPHGSGIERYNIIDRKYNEGKMSTLKDIQELMKELFYTNAYGVRNSAGNSGVWYSEFAGNYGELDVTVAYPKDFFDTYIMPIARQKLDQRSRYVPDTWQTTHSTIYDLAENKMYVCSQETGDYIEFDLNKGE